MSVKLTAGFFNQDKHLGMDFRNWIDIQYLRARGARTHAETAVAPGGHGVETGRWSGSVGRILCAGRPA